MKYTGIDLYPPRPEMALPPDRLDSLEKRGYVAQVKKNGTSNIIRVSPDGQVRCRTRRNEEHKAWALTDKSRFRFEHLPGKGWYVFAAELMHSKVHGLRDTNYVYDILVNAGDYLIGSTFMERQKILRRIFLRRKNITETYSHYVLDSNTWLAKVYDSGFGDLFKTLTKDEDEGLVTKDPNAQLDFCGKPDNNRNWQIKVRRPDISPNFSF